MIRVAFIINYGEAWLGGLNYFRNLLSSIEKLPNRKIEAVVFTSNKAIAKQFVDLTKTKIVRSRLVNPHSRVSRIVRILRRFSSHNKVMERLLYSHKIDVVSHAAPSAMGLHIPTIGWIPDFQHFYLSEFYHADEISRRIAENRLICTQSNIVLLSSYDAQKDLKKFFPEFSAKSKVLQFVADVSFDKNRTGIEILQSKYGFKGSYFLIANQFWAHKNHKVVIEALHELRKSGCEMLVLATGNTHDHRQPGFFQNIMSRAKELNVEDCFKVIGVVPREDLMGLMHDAVALINPSLFEGWSTNVEEAKSLGKRIILSDIAVHREQDPQGAVFFPADDARALANAMNEMVSNSNPDRDNEMMKRARKSLPDRQQDFAGAYQDIVLGVAGR